jgi:hypothetical protein
MPDKKKKISNVCSSALTVFGWMWKLRNRDYAKVILVRHGSIEENTWRGGKILLIPNVGIRRETTFACVHGLLHLRK